MTERPPIVRRVCLDCDFSTADDDVADMHFEQTGHMLAIDAPLLLDGREVMADD